MSSNVYMFKTAMNIAGVKYERWYVRYTSKAFDTMRYYFGQFGLGVKQELIYRMNLLVRWVEVVNQVSY